MEDSAIEIYDDTVFTQEEITEDSPSIEDTQPSISDALGALPDDAPVYSETYRS